MSPKILQINFKFSVSRTEYEQVCAQGAQPIADTPGLRWKVWLMNEAEREAGGIYLFDDAASVQAFLAGPIVAAVKSHPALSQWEWIRCLCHPPPRRRRLFGDLP